MSTPSWTCRCGRFNAAGVEACMCGDWRLCPRCEQYAAAKNGGTCDGCWEVETRLDWYLKSAAARDKVETALKLAKANAVGVKCAVDTGGDCMNPSCPPGTRHLSAEPPITVEALGELLPGPWVADGNTVRVPRKINDAVAGMAIDVGANGTAALLVSLHNQKPTKLSAWALKKVESIHVRAGDDILAFLYEAAYVFTEVEDQRDSIERERTSIEADRNRLAEMFDRLVEPATIAHVANEVRNLRRGWHPERVKRHLEIAREYLLKTPGGK